MRKTLAASLAATAILLSGCASGKASDAPPSAPPDTPSTTTPNSPERTAPAKSLDLADPCSIISPEQANGLGVDEEPYARDSNGVSGCNYRKGGTDGFNVFVAVNKATTMQQYAATQGASVTPAQINGYPATEKAGKTSFGILAVDISDHGMLMVKPVVIGESSTSADLAREFAETALKNLPNA